MAYLPGFFASVVYADPTLTTPNGNYDVSGLTFAMVYHQEEQEFQHRWTTWTLDADSTLLYQPQNGPNKLLIANTGHIYQLDDEVYTDDGKPIQVELVTGPIPEVSAQGDVLAHTYKRFTTIEWALATPPPSTGYQVTVKLTDVNNPNNYVERTITQFYSQIHVQMTLRCRQAFLSLKTVVGKDFDIVSLSYRFQQTADREPGQQHL